MSLEDQANIEHLAKLSRIKCSQEEKHRLATNLKKILSYMELLNEVNTDGVDPCTHVLETIYNVMGDDEIEGEMTREDFFKNAPDHVGGMIKVPPVIQFEE